MGFFFSYPVLLWGLLAGSIPLLIHLLRRRRVSTRVLPTIRFLQEVHKRQRFNIHLQDLLLLLLRTLLILLVVFALAGPKIVLGGWGRGLLSWLDRGDVRRVVLVDVSRSMAYEEVGKSRLASTAEVATTLLDELSPATQVMVIPFSDGGEEDLRALPASFSRDRDFWSRQVSLLNPTDRATNIAWALEKATEFLTGTADGGIFLLTDMQRSGWEDLLARRLDPEVFPYPVSVVDISRTPSRNIWFNELQLPVLPLAAGEPGQIHAEVAAEGYPEEQDLSLQVQLVAEDSENDESVLVQRDLLLRSRRPVSLSLPFQVKSAESFKGQLRLIPREITDPLTVDNKVNLEIPVISQLKCLVILPPEKNQEEDRFLQTILTLALGSGGDEDSPAAIDAQVFVAGQERIPDLADEQVVVLYGPPQISSEEESRLLRFVREGGGLLVFLDPLYSTGAEGQEDSLEWLNQLNVQIDPIQTVSREGTRLNWLQPTHPVYQVFNSAGEGLIGALRVWSPVAIQDGQGQALASFQVRSGTSNLNLQPAIVERDLDSGKMILAGIPLRAKESNLATSPVWLPLLQQFVKYLGSDPAQTPAEVDLLPRESNLAALGSQERTTLSQSLPISFSSATNISEAIASGRGSRDLTFLFLFLAICAGVAEVFVANRIG